jgi:uncharacterized protein YbbC (DUF1343 family)
MTLTLERESETKRKNLVEVRLGVEKLLDDRLDAIAGKRVGLICNQASVNHGFEHVADLFAKHPKVNLTALFGPQHGIRGDLQDNMIETDHAMDRKTGIPVYSLYSETRIPGESMLANVDTLVFDMQDVGCRIYTFVYTMANCMRAARQHGKKVIVCDRPNPINGNGVGGNILEPEFASFVGQFPLPTRHGMTPGELAQLFNKHFNLDCELEVIAMDGWRRELWQDETDAPWVLPSPNMPTIDSATVFPGTVHFEGTQISEGRGTTKPFELIGAPYINPDEYADYLNNLALPGVYFRACMFQPTFQKHAKVSCGGAQLHVIDRDIFEPVSAGIAMTKAAFDLYPNDFKWKEPPYEYVFDKNPFDVICGTDKIRKSFEQGIELNQILEGWQKPLQEFVKLRNDYLIYE